MKINGGATIWARQTIDSDIFCNKPDKWFKIWFYLIAEVNHKDNKQFKRGSCFMRYEWIMKKTKANKNEIDHCIRWLKLAMMIATQKATRGFTLKVLNYNGYQSLENYKSDTKSDSKSEMKAKQKRNESDTINKNDKNNKNINNVITNIYTHWNNQKVIVHRNINKYKSAIKAILKDYSEKEVITAITNYKIILDGNYRWDYRWELDKFLKRGIEKFKNLEIAKNNYKDYKQANTPTKCNTEEDILKVIGGNDDTISR